MTYEKKRGKPLKHPTERNKKQTHARQVKLMQMLLAGELDNNGLKDILFYIDERDEISPALAQTIGSDNKGEVFRESFDNHYKIYMGTHVTCSFLSPRNLMYETCRNSSDAYNDSLDAHMKSLDHLDWKDCLSDLLYRYNNNCYKNVDMNFNVSRKYYCLKGHHYVAQNAHWMCINALYHKKCKDCIGCVPIEPTYLL